MTAYPTIRSSMLREAISIAGEDLSEEQYYQIENISSQEGQYAAIKKLREFFPKKNFPCVCDHSKEGEECQNCNKLSSGPGKQYKDAYIYQVNGEMNRLKARLLTLIESLGLEKDQENAAKELFRSLSNESHANLLRDVTDFIYKQGWVNDEQRALLDYTRTNYV